MHKSQELHVHLAGLLTTEDKAFGTVLDIQEKALTRTGAGKERQDALVINAAKHGFDRGCVHLDFSQFQAEDLDIETQGKRRNAELAPDVTVDVGGECQIE